MVPRLRRPLPMLTSILSVFRSPVPSVAFPGRSCHPADVGMIFGVFSAAPSVVAELRDSVVAGDGGADDTPRPEAADWPLEVLAEFLACECVDIGVPADDILEGALDRAWALLPA